MGKEDIYETYKAAPKAKIIVSHMEAVNHWGLSKEELKSFFFIVFNRHHESSLPS
jgi:hypothetical protein